MKILGNPLLFVIILYIFFGNPIDLYENPSNPFLFVKISHTFFGNPIGLYETLWKSFSLRENPVQNLWEYYCCV